MQLPADQLHEVIAMLAYQSMKAQDAAAQNHMAAQSLSQQLTDAVGAHAETRRELEAVRTELAIANETLNAWAHLRAAAAQADATPAAPTGDDSAPL